ncbi:acyl carrier protein [Archangium lipolyticum]|uniref:acyl carrier protein n=1 Tax=Archangium lipolyticum TaxID=2970465 RepID=UPI00214A29A9|nr:acyl carrier protein [Archangium lipolyticum]
MDIRREIRSFIESQAIFNKEKLAFGDDDNFFELRIVSSLFAMQLVTHLEKTFNLTLEDDDLDISNFGSINAIVRFIERKKPAQATAG